MKIVELIEKLSKFDPEDNVFVYDPGISEVIPVEAVAEYQGNYPDQEGVVIYMED